MNFGIFLSLIFFAHIQSGRCAKILGVFPFMAKSHFILANGLMKGLADFGNDVTIIAPFLDEDPPKNGSYKTVLLTGLEKEYQDTLKVWNLMESDDANSIMHPFNAQTIVLQTIELVLNYTNVQKLLKSGEKFDVVIMEKFYNDAFLAFAHHFKVPLILFSAIGPSPCINGMIGNPEPFSYVRHFVTTYPIPMTFFQKIQNSFLYVFQEIMDQFYFLPQHEKIMKKYFPDAPSIYDLYHNISFVFTNSHESYAQSVPLVPNIRPIGGFHIRTKPLPQELQTFLDNAKEGVIYFNLGSNLKSKDLPEFKRNALLNAFKKLNETVLMKWEEDVFVGQPENVHVRKWLPQSDILAHPNIKLFITHGGLLGLTEAIYHGVPMLAIPFFADQHQNALLAQTDEYALMLPYTDPNFSEEKVSQMLNDLLHDPKYRENAKMRSRLFHDRPLSPQETVNFWVNYVIRNKGANHLRVAGVKLPWYQYHLVDVIGFLLATIFVILYLLYKFIIICTKNRKAKSKLKKN